MAKEKTTLKHYQDALFAYEGGACNPLALTNHLYQATQHFRDLGSDALAKHPVVRLYLAQLNWLAGLGIGDCNGADDEARRYITEHGGDKPAREPGACDVGSDTYEPCPNPATVNGMCDKHKDC